MNNDQKFEQLLKELKKCEVYQKGDWDVHIPEDVWNEHLHNNFKLVAEDLYPEKHRWYEIVTHVIKVYDRFIGITCVGQLYSEGMDTEACFHKLQFNEMEEKQTISYTYKVEL